MKICKFLQADHIYMDVPLEDKTAVLRFVAAAGEKSGVVKDGATLYEGLRQREEIMSTGVGEGIAMPHTMNREVADATVFLIRPRQAIDFEALDGRPVDVVLALVIPEDQTTLHLRLLAGVSRLCKNAQVLDAIRSAGDADSLWNALYALEEKMAFH